MHIMCRLQIRKMFKIYVAHVYVRSICVCTYVRVYTIIIMNADVWLQIWLILHHTVTAVWGSYWEHCRDIVYYTCSPLSKKPCLKYECLSTYVCSILICIHMYMYIYYIRMYVRMYICVCINLSVCVCIRTYVRTYIHTYVCVLSKPCIHDTTV